jgi:hypothetical protein
MEKCIDVRDRPTRNQRYSAVASTIQASQQIKQWRIDHDGIRRRRNV